MEMYPQPDVNIIIIVNIYIYMSFFLNRISILGDGEINLSPRRYHRLSRILQCMFSINIVWTTYRGAQLRSISKPTQLSCWWFNRPHVKTCRLLTSMNLWGHGQNPAQTGSESPGMPVATWFAERPNRDIIRLVWFQSDLLGKLWVIVLMVYIVIYIYIYIILFLFAIFCYK